MFDQAGVPFVMQVAGILPALGGPELRDVNIISSTGLGHSVHGLVNVSNKMDDEFQRLSLVLLAGALIGQHLPEHGYAVHHAIVVVIFRSGTFLVWLIAVARLREAG